MINLSNLCYLCLTCICIGVTVTEDKDTDEVTLNCSLLTYEDCHHTVKWLLNGYNVDRTNNLTERSQTDCFTTVWNSHNSNVSRDNIVKCQGTHTNTSKVLFTIIHQASGEEAGEITISCWTWMAGYKVWMQISFSFFHNKWKNWKMFWLWFFIYLVGTNKTKNPARKTVSSTTSVTTTAVKDISKGSHSNIHPFVMNYRFFFD